MSQLKRRFLAFAVAIAAVVTGVGLVAGIQPAVASNGVTCDSGFGTKVPVLMVHGFNADAGVWGDDDSPGSMYKALGGIKDTYRVRFDYKEVHDQWVTNDAIGPKLAKTIDCLAQASRKSGGKGKVIVVAHSMGGLATRFAANQTVEGRKVADELALVITLGTPHQGSLLANAGTAIATFACQGAQNAVESLNPLLGFLMTKEECLANLALKGLGKDSKELVALKPFPPNVPVRAIAGDTRIYVQFLFTEFAKTGTQSDLVVGKISATAEFTQTNQGDGMFVFRCDVRRYASNKKWQGGECTHNEMYKTGYIQESVLNGIKEYLESTKRLPEPEGFRGDLFGKMSLIYRKDWGGAMSEPDAVRNVVDESSCKGPQADCPHIYFMNMDSASVRQSYGSDPVAAWSSRKCTAGHTNSPVEDLGEVKIGGEPARHYRVLLCGSPSDMWLVKSRGVFIATTTTKLAGVSLPNLYAVFDHIRWF